MTPSEFLLSGRFPGPQSVGVMESVAARAVDELAATLEHELTIEREPGYDEDGFSARVRSPSLGHRQWTFSIRAIVGAQAFGDTFLIRAWVFCYLGGARITTPSGELVELEYNGSERAWKPIGWQWGEHGEHDGFEWFDDNPPAVEGPTVAEKPS